MAWKPGAGWPSQAQLTYIAALVTIVGAALIAFRTLRAGGGGWR
jgi:hypothetical protein